MTSVTSLYNCPCSGAFPIGGAASQFANGYAGVVSIPATGPPGMQSPYQFRLFESAFFSNQPQVAVIPYSPATIVAATPIFYNTAGAVVAAAATAPPTAAPPAVTAPPVPTVVLAQTGAGGAPAPASAPMSFSVQGATAQYSTQPPLGFRANGCGCAVTARSPLTPGGVNAWLPLLQQFNAPYESLAGQACQGRLGW